MEATDDPDFAVVVAAAVSLQRPSPSPCCRGGSRGLCTVRPPRRRQAAWQHLPSATSPSSSYRSTVRLALVSADSSRRRLTGGTPLGWRTLRIYRPPPLNGSTTRISFGSSPSRRSHLWPQRHRSHPACGRPPSMPWSLDPSSSASGSVVRPPTNPRDPPMGPHRRRRSASTQWDSEKYVFGKTE